MPGQNLTRAEAEARAAIVSTDSYVVELDLTTAEDTFASTSTVRFSATPGESTFIDLIAPSVQKITLNGVDLDPATHFADSRISLPDLKADNELVVEATCEYMHTGEGLHKFVDPEDGEVYLYSQFEVADTRRVYAVFEQPDLKATFQFTVTAPAHWVVVSNSPTPEPAAAGADAQRWAFPATTVLPCYVTAIVAGPYHVVEGSVLSRKGRLGANVYCRKALAQYLDADVILDATQAGFDFYEKLFEMDYPFEKYDQLFVPEFNAGAMENAGCVTFLEDYVFRGKVPAARIERRTVTILHELAHMWFGDLVTMKWWNDLWLNESFAEFVSTLATAEATQYKNSWTTFNTLEKSWANRQDQLPSTHPIVANIRDLEDVEVNFDGITYAKGASVLRQLVAWVGQDAFFAGVAEYFRKHHHSNTTLRDLLVELEKTSGRELDSWSAVWLEKAGITTLRPEIHVDSNGDISSFAILQEVPEEWPTQRPHRIGIGGYDVVKAAGGGHELKRSFYKEVDIDGERTDIDALDGLHRPALLLVNDNDLAYCKVRLDPDSLATAVEHLAGFTDPLPRSMVLGAAWDMTRDGEMPARQFVDLVLKNIGEETESTVVLVLLRQLATTIDLYVDPAAAGEISRGAAGALLELAREAAPGSDNQLQFVKAFASRAETPEQLDAAEALLGVVSGTTDDSALPGLGVDTDLQWDLLNSLIAGGRAGAAEIDAQLAKDNTASGYRRAEHAKAAIPTAAAKKTAWAALIDPADGQELPNAKMFEAIAGFNRAHDTSLLEPYAAEYFAMLRRTYTDRTNETAQNLIEGLYPVGLAGRVADLQDQADAWLAANDDAHDALKRMVIEGRDGVRRALAAQAADAAAFQPTNCWPIPPVQ